MFFLNVPLAVIVVAALAAVHGREPRSARGRRGSTGRAPRSRCSASAASSSACSNGRRSAPASARARALAVGVVVARRCSSSSSAARRTRCCRCDLFRSRTFTLANVLTLLLYAALAIVFFLVPLNLIQVQHYSATAAGAALLPFPLIMFALSRWSGGLVARVGSRLPLTVGPADRRAGSGAVRAPGNRRLVLDDVLSRRWSCSASAWRSRSRR